ncbi:hypothetical protein PAPHI01_1161 [Pancytospora philotis]|nr:hypothetical protein PAPHI01_1161 [Pancytospora philotis]
MITAERRDSLLELRRPLFKRIAQKDLDKSSQLYMHYRNNTVTQELLLDSSEDAFTVAFYYSSAFDIMDYLRHLRRSDITNVAYNVMKEYLKDASAAAICEITAPVQSDLGSQLLAILRGELFRISGIPLDLASADEYTVFGYVTMYDILAQSFEEVFGAYAKINPRIIALLDINEPRVQAACAGSIAHVFEYLLETGTIYRIVPALDFKLIDGDCVVRLLSEASLKHVENASRVAMAAQIIDKLAVEADFVHFVSTATRALCTPASFTKLFEPLSASVRSHLKRTEHALSADCVEALAALSYVIMHHTKMFTTAAHFASAAVAEHIRCDIAAGLEKFSIDALMKALAGPESSFITDARLYVIYNAFLDTHTPSIAEVLGLPDTFFMLSLARIDTAEARLLREFHINLAHDRIKQRVASSISKDLLAAYLIKRNIWFPMDMQPYAAQMTDRYKLLYAQYNLEWAVANIDEIRRIGITKHIWTVISLSAHKDILNEADRRAVDLQVIGTEHGKRALEDETSEEHERRVKAMKGVLFRWKEEDAPENGATAADDAVVINDIAYKPGINTNVSQIYDTLRSEQNDFSECFSKIASDAEYLYTFKSIYEWVQDSRHVAKLGLLLKATAPFYALRYGDFSEMVAAMVAKAADHSILAHVVCSVSSEDVLRIIADYPDRSDEIAAGIGLMHGKYANPERLECGLPHLLDALKDRLARNGAEAAEASLLAATQLVGGLVTSTANSEVLVGVKAARFLDGHGFDIAGLLGTSDDAILGYVAQQIEKGQHNAEILRIIFSRGVLDGITATLIAKLDTASVSSANMNRIYSMFYIAPLSYIEYKIYEHGFTLNDNMVTELVAALSSLYESELFGRVAQILGSYRFTQPCYHAIIQRLDTRNALFKVWAVEALGDMKAISLPYFVQYCRFIANEDDLSIVGQALRVLLRIFRYEPSALQENTASSETRPLRSCILKWAENKKLIQLVRRVYPLCMENPQRCMTLVRNCPSSEESAMLREVYQLRNE